MATAMMRPADPLRLNPDRPPDSGSIDFILAAAEGCLERALLSAAFDNESVQVDDCKRRDRTGERQERCQT